MNINKKIILYGFIFIGAFIFTLTYLFFQKDESNMKTLEGKEQSEVAQKEDDFIRLDSDEVYDEIDEEVENISEDSDSVLDPQFPIGFEKELKRLEKDILAFEEANGIIRKKEIQIVASEDVLEDFSYEHNLPIDPGYENDQTLLGIDRNNNEIRDDLERVIAYNYREYPELVDLYNVGMILSQRDHQNVLEGNFTDEVFKQSEEAMADFIVCDGLYSDMYEVESFVIDLSYMDANTSDRWNSMSSMASKANLYSLQGEEKYHPVASEEFCQKFISKIVN